MGKPFKLTGFCAALAVIALVLAAPVPAWSETAEISLVMSNQARTKGKKPAVEFPAPEGMVKIKNPGGLIKNGWPDSPGDLIFYAPAEAWNRFIIEEAGRPMPDAMAFIFTMNVAGSNEIGPVDLAPLQEQMKDDYAARGIDLLDEGPGFLTIRTIESRPSGQTGATFEAATVTSMIFTEKGQLLVLFMGSALDSAYKSRLHADAMQWRDACLKLKQ